MRRVSLVLVAALLGFATPVSADDSVRSELGGLLWGSGFLQAVYRAPLSHYIKVELGGGAVPLPTIFAGSLTAGLAWDILPNADVYPTVALGPGAALTCGEGEVPRDDGTEGFGLRCTSLLYGHALTGIAIRMGRARRFRATITGGAWYGILSKDHDQRPARTFLVPALGLGFFVAL